LYAGFCTARSAVAAIHLGLPLPAGSSGPPAGWGGPPSFACAGRPLAEATLSTLLRVGFTEPPRSPGVLVGSYPAVSPLPPRGAPPASGRAARARWRSFFGAPAPRVTPGAG